MGSVPTQPREITPLSYRLSIFDIRFAPDWLFNASITIEAQVSEPSTEIVLHAAGLKIACVELSQGSKESAICKPIKTSNSDDGTICLSLSKALRTGIVHIKIEYEASIGNSMVGFFRAKYRAADSSTSTIRDDKYSVILATHFEPCHARYAFPCFDMPHLKATFEVDIEIPEKLTALGNMPVRDTRKLTGSKNGLKRVHFEKTPVMSTYLLAWAVGEFEYVEALTEKQHGGVQIPVRVYTPLGLTQYAELALECAWKVLDLFKQLFEIDYPIPKCDHLIVPEFVSGAMENWGLITYKPTKILFDPKTSNNRVMSKAVYVVAHELAHQWFGNLVTMQSWSELWLNEGFATWAGYLAVDYLFPEWNIWGQYVAEIMDDVLKLDSLPTTHAIETLVQDENDALQMFDQISYFKASSVIRMLATQIGQDTFLRGLTSYLRKHAYQNARSQDLWDALSEVSGINVSELMDSWIHTCGFPVLQVPNPIVRNALKQSSIFSTEIHETTGSWHLPRVGAPEEKDQLLSWYNNPSQSSKTGSFVLNRAHVGYCCVDHDQNAAELIVQSLPVLSSSDLAGVIVDKNILAINNLKPTSELLDLIWNLKDTTDCFAWLSISRTLSYLSSVFSTDATIMVGLNSYIDALISSAKHRVKWTAEPMTYTQSELNKSIISLAFSAGMENSESLIQEARRYFERWATGVNGVLPPSLRGVVLSGCISIGTENDFELVKQMFQSDKSLDGQEIILNALGCVNDTVLAEQILDFAFSGDSVALQHLHLLGGALGQNNVCRITQWEYAKRNWSKVSHRLEANAVCRDWWIEESLRHFSDLTLEEDVNTFLRENAGSVINKPLEYVKANIRRNATYKERAREDIYCWLVSHCFMPIKQ